MMTENADTPTAADNESAAVSMNDEDPGVAAGDESHAVSDDDTAPTRFRTRRIAPPRLALAFGIVALLSLGTLAGWFGYRMWESRQINQRQELFLRVGRQGAQDLSSINWTEADADVKRILDMSTGEFHDDFQLRSQPFVEFLKKSQSSTQGTVTEAGFESVADDSAEVLVAVSVHMTAAADSQQPLKSYRMRIGVQRVGGDAKVSTVTFIE
jgi:Mce-associated membrane protein